MVPSVGHFLAVGHGHLHVHGRHGNGALPDPACEPGNQPDAPPWIKVEEAADGLPAAGLLSASDQLSVSRTWTKVNMTGR